MARARTTNSRATLAAPQTANATSGRQPTSTTRERGGAHRKGRGRDHSATTWNHTTTLRISREPTPEMSASLPPPSHEGNTAEALASMQRVIEGLADRIDRQERVGKHNTAPPQP